MTLFVIGLVTGGWLGFALRHPKRDPWDELARRDRAPRVLP